MAVNFTDTKIHRRQDTLMLDARDLLANAPAFTGRAGRTDDAVNEMVASLLAVGQLQAIVLRKRFDGNPEPVAGFTRLQAAAKITNECMRSDAGVQYSPAAPFLVSCVNRALNEREALFATLTENDTRTALTPMDYALFIRAASESHGMTDAEIAKGLGKDGGWVSRHRVLLSLDEPTRQMVASGEIALAPAVDVVAHIAPDARPAVIERAKAANNGRATSAALTQAAQDLGATSGKPKKPTDKDFKAWIVDMMQDECRAVDAQAFLSGILEYRDGEISAGQLRKLFNTMTGRK